MKSKIEEKIEKAREATNEMFAAFDEMNERLSEKFEKWSLRDGEYYAAQKSGSPIWIGIKRGNGIYFDGQDIPDYCHICSGEEGTLNIYNSELVFVKSVRPATPEEIALLDSKLAEQGKRFDKEKLELVDIPKEPKFKKGDLVRTPDGYIFEVSEAVTNTMKTEWLYCKNPKMTFFGNYIEESKLQKWEPKHKEPIIGEMAIFWDTDNKKAFCATLNSMINGRYSPDGNIRFDNAILFESPEQYKDFLKS